VLPWPAWGYSAAARRPARTTPVPVKKVIRAGEAFHGRRHRLQRQMTVSRYRRITDLSGQMIAVGRADADRGRSGGALVAVMKPADRGDCDDTPGGNRLHLTPSWAVVVETLVRPRNVVVHEVRAKQATQMTFVDHDDVIEAFPSNRPDDALGEGILPGRPRGDEDLSHPQAGHPPYKHVAVDGIPIAEQVVPVTSLAEASDHYMVSACGRAGAPEQARGNGCVKRVGGRRRDTGRPSSSLDHRGGPSLKDRSDLLL